jgi:hypothetical protein
MPGSLNFKDDETHVRVYNHRELAKLLTENGYTVLSSGTRRSWFYIALIPFRIISFGLRGKKLVGNIFWDLLGFAEYVYAVKH